jgi:hypothetical protein
MYDIHTKIRLKTIKQSLICISKYNNFDMLVVKKDLE